MFRFMEKRIKNREQMMKVSLSEKNNYRERLAMQILSVYVETASVLDC